MRGLNGDVEGGQADRPDDVVVERIDEHNHSRGIVSGQFMVNRLHPVGGEYTS